VRRIQLQGASNSHKPIADARATAEQKKEDVVEDRKEKGGKSREDNMK
jgi:hypothetical protein